MFDLDKLSLSDMIPDDTEFIPLVAGDEDQIFQMENVPEHLPILPLRNTVLFPGVVIPITVGRDKSIRLIKDVHAANKIVGVVSQRDSSIEDPSSGDLYDVGTVAQIVKMFRMPDGSTTVIIQGKRRFMLGETLQEDPYMVARITLLEEVKPEPENTELKDLIAKIREMAAMIVEQSPNIPSEANFALKSIESPSFLLNFISSNLNIDAENKQMILEMSDLVLRAKHIITELEKELQSAEIKSQIHQKVRTDIDKQQREYFLHQQMRQIQEELGTGEAQTLKEIKERGEKKIWSQKVEQIFQKEVAKLERMNPMVAEYSVQVGYLEFMLDLPWEEHSQDNFDLHHAQEILDRDHFGLEKVKERIIEHLAVLKLKGNLKAPILCLVGPPGVGKTSLGKSVAEALNRKYIRMALGGLKDESEIRGHRRTYIGAMSGRILTNLKKAGTGNPVFILDEIDKVGNDFHGDPSSALLEVLDPEQNTTFHDNYLDMEYDLSKVLFIATANSLSSIQPALLDRMEIIQLSGYSVEEKIEIAVRHLITKQAEEHALKSSDIKLGRPEIEYIIENYTRESGVRGLDRTIAKIARYVARLKATKQKLPAKFTTALLEKILGAAHPKDKYETNAYAGVVIGLAWTQVGGDILYIETSISPGKGRLTLTGNLGEVMKESAMLALEYLKAHASDFGITAEVFDKWNVHIHVPEGATPKDGPSAGITMLTALASAFTQRKVKARLAMTGEITLRGQVLPVGGIKEKILAAKRANIKEIILCEDNRRDILEINERYLKGLTFHYVKRMSEVLDIALLNQKVQNAVKIQ